jgi:hypothetical protein
MWRLVNEWGYSVVAGSAGRVKIAQMFFAVKEFYDRRSRFPLLSFLVLALVSQAFDQLRQDFPLPLLGLASGNDSNS